MPGERQCGPQIGDENSILRAALDYHGLGWSIIPIAGGTKKPPKSFRWKQYQKRRATTDEIRDWFADRDDLALAVIFGAVSGGLVCRDFDEIESYRRWCRSHVDLAKSLPTVATKRGRHVYFRAAPSHQVFVDLRPNEPGEYRGDSGHYSLLPPSKHPHGPLYKWSLPLPSGDVPLVDDVVAAGLFPNGRETQKAQGSPKWLGRVEGEPSGQSGGSLSPRAQQLIEEASARSIPTKPGERRRKLLDLARRLKFAPEFAGTSAANIDFLKPYLQRWWKVAKPHTSGEHPHFWESWQDFVGAWEEASVPYGATMEAILKEARCCVAPRKAVEKYGDGSLRALLASLCRQLQLRSGGQRFYLTGRTAGPLLGVSDTRAWRWLKQLEKDQIIVAVQRHPRGVRLATEYRYVAD